jgi:hypothetical protein
LTLEEETKNYFKNSKGVVLVGFFSNEKGKFGKREIWKKVTKWVVYKK